MSQNPTTITLRDPMGTEAEAWQPEPVLPSLFLAAASVILAVQNPIHVNYQPQPILTAVVVALGIALSGWGLLKGLMPAILAGAGVLVAGIALGVSTQPVQFGVQPASVWPLRVALVILVAGAWAFLLRPPLFVRRAVVALTVPTALLLAFVGLPGTADQLPNRVPLTPPQPDNFAPYWLAIDSLDRLYATDTENGQIYAFDPSGRPVGTLRPGLAPAVGTPGPGILPVGFATQLDIPGSGVIPTPTPVTVTLQMEQVPFSFCGLATGPDDSLYVMDLSDPGSHKLLRFDREGNTEARWPMPEGYEPVRGCLSTDQERVYASSRFGRVHAFTHDGEPVREFAVQYQPFAISTSGDGELLVMGPNVLNRFEVSTGAVTTMTLPPPPGQLQIPYQAMLLTKKGEMLVTDLGSNKVLRIDPQSAQIIGSIGSEGFWPGQFKGPGGLAEDSKGRIYVADWQTRTIQRFTPDGQLDAVWWARQFIRKPPAPPSEAELEGR